MSHPDGLADEQREQLRQRFREGMGHRPDPEEFRAEAEGVAVWLSEAEAGKAARRALVESGYTYAELADQHARHDFDDLRARLTWEAVRHVGDPEAK